jgi:hypothetical protein
MMMNMENEYAMKLKSRMKNPNPTQEIKIDGLGTAKLYGNWNAEKLIKRLLESESITG